MLSKWEWRFRFFTRYSACDLIGRNGRYAGKMRNEIGKMTFSLSLYFIALFTRCSFSENEMIGMYTPVNYKNTLDTINLQFNGNYHRKIYDKNRKLMLEMDGKWNMIN